jgi:hypothetical protein
VAGHVDDPNLAAGRQLQPGEAEVDSEPAPLLFFEPVRIDTRQSLNEG